MRKFNPAGTDIFEEDWDNLIILDACRWDIFSQEHSLNGELSHRTSRGAATREFVWGNFYDKRLHDTVYVTGNSWYYLLKDEINAEVHAFFNPNFRTPEPVTETALEKHGEFPNKRLIVHYIPPHQPYVGPTAEVHFPEYDEQLDALLEKIKSGELDVSRDVLHRAYRENLQRVLPEVEKLLEEFTGRTVVTADHGELLGERCHPVPIRDFGHHQGLYVEELVKVPWLVHENGKRKHVVSDDPVDQEETDVESVEERLRQLGYKF